MKFLKLALNTNLPFTGSFIISLYISWFMPTPFRYLFPYLDGYYHYVTYFLTFILYKQCPMLYPRSLQLLSYPIVKSFLVYSHSSSYRIIIFPVFEIDSVGIYKRDLSMLFYQKPHLGRPTFPQIS